MLKSGVSPTRQPLHIIISEKLKAQIDAGLYVSGERLPSEFDLGELFGVSRTTIRHAVANLIQQGIVITQQGRGIFVCDRQKISFSMSNPLMHSDVALQQQGYTAKIESIAFQLVDAPPEVAKKLQLSGALLSVYQQKKIIYADDTPIAMEIDYFPEKIGHALTDQLQQGFTYSTLTANGIGLKSAKVSLESIPTTYELSEHLAAPLGMPLLVFNYVAYGNFTDRSVANGSVANGSVVNKETAQPAVCGRTLSRADWTCYISEFEM